MIEKVSSVIKATPKWLIVILICTVIIAVGLIALYRDTGSYMMYDDFKNNAESGNISSVTIEGFKVYFKTDDGNKKYYTVNPRTDDFKEWLTEMGVEVWDKTS